MAEGGNRSSGDEDACTAPADCAAKAQAILDDVVARAQWHYGRPFALQMAWRMPGCKFSAAAGGTPGKNVTVHDTFLFGSGTKAVTAAAALALMDEGVIDGHASVLNIINASAQHSRLAELLLRLFGEQFRDVTLLHLLHMKAGIPDFEEPTPPYKFDTEVLNHGNDLWLPSASLQFASRMGGYKLLCAPGSCTVYSTASYELVGLALSAVLGVPYDQLELGKYVGMPQLVYPNNSRPLSSWLTVPGMCLSPDWPQKIIYDQNPSILGGPGGLLVATTAEVAEFYERLFSRHLLLSIESMNSILRSS
eukprot:TRINITY_DN31316_c0_g1_i4.p1 TRINITY_DN31316_c0_g1~~TRINITY_DN31316_c0_g1_i4.p1  ORF type:complete len:307 (-),score=43.10 TRINITY_DN31316_c0_g1_i4:45-965(-)